MIRAWTCAALVVASLCFMAVGYHWPALAFAGWSCVRAVEMWSEAL